MPLKGEAKKEYQRDYMRKRQGTKNPRAGLLDPPEVIRPTVLDPKPIIRPSQKGGATPLTPKQEKLAELRQIIEPLQSTRSPSKEESNGRIPLYNQETSQVGDRVRMPDGQVLTVPELDDERNPIPEKGVTGRLVSDNLFKPSFQPDVKVVRVKKKKW